MNKLMDSAEFSNPVRWPDSAPQLYAIVPSKDAYAELCRALQAISLPKATLIDADTESLRSRYPVQGRPTVLFLEMNAPEAADIEQLRQFKHSADGRACHVVIVARDLASDTMVQLLRAGAEEFLRQPSSTAELSEILLRIRGKTHKAEPRNASAGQVVTFAHASGGVGATTLAVNAATLLAEVLKGDAAVSLLDLNVQFGAVADQLDLSRHSPISDLTDAPERLDSEMLENMMVSAESGIRVLTAPRIPLPYESLSQETLRDLLGLTRQRYRYSVVDLPQALTPWTDEILRRSDIIFLVLKLNIASIRQTRRYLDLLEHEGLGNLPIRLVANRVSTTRPLGDEVSLAQIEKALGRKLDHRIPEDYELVEKAINHGQPAALLGRKSKYIQSVSAMLSEACRVQIGDQRGVLKKLFGGANVEKNAG